MTHYEKQRDIYDQLVALCPRFERKGKTMPYTSANGYMFSLLNKDAELGIRLPKAEGEKFREEHQSPGPYKSHGAVMKDYVRIPNEMLKDLDLLATYLNKSYDYVMTLPPK